MRKENFEKKNNEILRYAQNDRGNVQKDEKNVQNDKAGSDYNEKKPELIEGETMKKLYCKSCENEQEFLFNGTQEAFKNIPGFNLWQCKKCKGDIVI